jgi:hypothetical protein
MVEITGDQDNRKKLCGFELIVCTEVPDITPEKKNLSDHTYRRKHEYIIYDQQNSPHHIGNTEFSISMLKISNDEETVSHIGDNREDTMVEESKKDSRLYNKECLSQINLILAVLNKGRKSDTSNCYEVDQ